jgi:hypothetical protein
MNHSSCNQLSVIYDENYYLIILQYKHTYNNNSPYLPIGGMKGSDVSWQTKPPLIFGSTRADSANVGQLAHSDAESSFLRTSSSRPESLMPSDILSINITGGRSSMPGNAAVTRTLYQPEFGPTQRQPTTTQSSDTWFVRTVRDMEEPITALILPQWGLSRNVISGPLDTFSKIAPLRGPFENLQNSPMYISNDTGDNTPAQYKSSVEHQQNEFVFEGRETVHRATPINQHSQRQGYSDSFAWT